jgi:uncharacterized protein YkwD
MPIVVPLPPTANVAQTKGEAAIVREINRVRGAHGLHAVRSTPSLERLARAHSREMLRHDVLSHSSFNGLSFTARLSLAGRHRRYGETLAWAPNGSGANARVLVGLWMASAHHRAVLLDGSLRRVGVGRIAGAMGRQAGAAITADFSS